MVERAGSMAFAAGAWVFPGGRIDEADRIAGQEAALHPAAVAAIRETLEETAVPVGLLPTPDAKQARDLQDTLVAGGQFRKLLIGGVLQLDAAALVPFARW